MTQSRAVATNHAERTRRDDLRTLLAHMYDAQAKAIDSLARYKFQMFGYWAGVWVHLNKLTKEMGYHGAPNPFAFLVMRAREVRAQAEKRGGYAGADRTSAAESNG